MIIYNAVLDKDGISHYYKNFNSAIFFIWNEYVNTYKDNITVKDWNDLYNKHEIENFGWVDTCIVHEDEDGLN